MNLYKFNSSKYTNSNFDSMFHSCSSLEIINLKSSIISNDFINKILSITSKNLSICSDIEISGSTLIFEQEIICNGISNNELP